MKQELQESKEEYEEKEDENIKLWEEVETMKDNCNKVKSLAVRMTKMEKKVAKQRERNESLRIQNTTFKNRVKFIQMHATDLEEESDRLQLSLAASQKDLRHLKAEYDEQENAKQTLEERVQFLERRNKELKDCQMKLEHKIHDMHAKFEEKNIENYRLKEKVEVLEKHNNEMQAVNTKISENLSKFGQAADNLQTKLDDLQAKNVQWQLNYADLENKNNEMKSKIAKLEKDIDVFDSSYKEKEEELDHLQHDIVKLCEEICTLSDVNLGFKKSLDELSAACKDLDVTSTDQKNMIAELEESLKQQQHASQKERNTYEERMESLNLTVAELTQKLKEMTAQRNDILHDNDNLTATTVNQQDKIHELEEKLMAQKKQNAKDIIEYEEQTSSLESMITDLKEKISSISDDKEDLEEAVGNLNALVESLRAENADLTRGDEIQQKTVAIQRDATRQFGEDIKILEDLCQKASNTYEQRISRLDSLVKDCEARISHLTSDNESLQEDINVQGQLKQQTTSNYEEKISALNLLVADLQAQQEEMIAIKEQITSENNSLQTTTTTQRGIISELEDTVNDLKAKVDELQEKKRGRIAKLFARIRRGSRN